VGCLVVNNPADGRSETDPPRTDPAFRSDGIAYVLLRTTLEHETESHVGIVRLTAWKRRTV
jgi:hypothetical protein